VDTLLGFGLVLLLIGLVAVSIALRSERAKRSGSLRKTLVSFVSQPDDDLGGHTFIFGAAALLIGVLALIMKAQGYEMTR
jgi:hypothetical protein